MVKNLPPMQEMRVRSLIWEDPMCRGAAKPEHHHCWAELCNKRRRCSETPSRCGETPSRCGERAVSAHCNQRSRAATKTAKWPQQPHTNEQTKNTLKIKWKSTEPARDAGYIQYCEHTTWHWIVPIKILILCYVNVISEKKKQYSLNSPSLEKQHAF